MAVWYPNLFYNKTCYKETALYIINKRKTKLQITYNEMTDDSKTSWNLKTDCIDKVFLSTNTENTHNIIKYMEFLNPYVIAKEKDLKAKSTLRRITPGRTLKYRSWSPQLLYKVITVVVPGQSCTDPGIFVSGGPTHRKMLQQLFLVLKYFTEGVQYLFQRKL